MCRCPEAVDGGEAPAIVLPSDAVSVLDRVQADAPFFNSAAEQTIYSFAVPAGRVALPGQTLRLRLRGDMLVAIVGAPTFILRARFGGLLWYQDTAIGRTNNPVAIPWRLDIEIARKGALLFYGSGVYDGANAIGAVPVGGGDLGLTGTSSSPTVPIDSLGDRACDFSIAQTLAISIQFSAADPNIGTTLRSGTLVLE